MEVNLLVTYIAKPGCREQFVREVVAQGALAAVHAEDGCQQYEYFFSAENENVVMLKERWESEAHLRAHLAQPHMATIAALKAQYVESVTLVKMQEEPYAL